MVDQFIERYAKPRQRTWDQTQRALKINCRAWLKKPMHSITKRDAYALLDPIVADGRGPTAEITLAWLRTLWKWAYKRDIVPAPIMDQVEIHYERQTRERVYSDDEIKAIWQAADKLEKIGRAAEKEAENEADKRKVYHGAYTKLLVLLAPRKTALAQMRRSHLDDPDNPTMWTTPHELTKTKKTVTKRRTYLTPLRPLAQRILKGLKPRDHSPTLLFPGRKKGSHWTPVRR